MSALEDQLSETMSTAWDAYQRGEKQRKREERRAKRTCAKCGAAMMRTSARYVLCPHCPDAKLMPLEGRS